MALRRSGTCIFAGSPGAAGRSASLFPAISRLRREAATGSTGWWWAPVGSRSASGAVGDLQPVSLALAQAPHRPYPHKTTERAQFDRALEEAREAGADDALLVNEGGYVTECAIWTLFWWEGDRICTPALMLGILPGVARARIAELAGDLAERRVRVGDIEGRSLFVANAVRGVVPVRSFRGPSGAARPRNIAAFRIVLVLTEGPRTR